jgi:DNA-binding CsgD family transcriptional regulator
VFLDSLRPRGADVVPYRWWNIRVEADRIDQLFNSTEKRLARTLLLLAEGRPIAAKRSLHLSVSVSRRSETHRSNIMRKLGMHSVSELVHWAVKNNMIEP